MPPLPALPPASAPNVILPARPAPPPRPAPATRGPVTPSLGGNTFNSPVPQTPLSRPNASPGVGNPAFGSSPTPQLGMGAGTAAPPSTSFPTTPGPNQGPSVNPQGPPPGRVQPSRPTNKFNQPDFSKPNPNTTKRPTPATGPDLGTTLGGGAALGALGAGAAAAALGSTPPGWVIGGAALLGAAAAAAASRQFWPPPPGDGTEGAKLLISEATAGVEGQTGQVPGASYQLWWRAKQYSNSEWSGWARYTAAGATGTGPRSPLTKTRVPPIYSASKGDYYDWVYLEQGGYSYSFQWIWDVEAYWKRADGTTIEADIAAGAPAIPAAPQIAITQNIQVGDTVLNFNPAPQLAPRTPTIPPPVAPPTLQSPTPTGPQGALTPSPSPQSQPSPPATGTPSAPTTAAGTPTANAPTTGPRPSPGSAPSGGGGGGGNSGAGTAAGLIAGTSPGVAGLITATNNALNPKPQTPTGTPVVIPGSDTATGPNNQPVNQTQPSVVPGTNTTPGTTPTPGQNTVGNQIGQSNQQQQNSQQQLIDQLTNPTGQGTTTTTTTTTTINQQLLDLQRKSDADLASTLAILGTLATTAALNQSTTTITTAIQNQPSPCSYPAYHPQNQAERAAISGKVDGVNTVLGTVTNVQIAEARTGINSIITSIGTAGTGAFSTIFGGLQAIQTWGTNFSRALHLDRVLNALSFMLQVHNAAMLSRNLGESMGELINSALQALGLKDEEDQPIEFTQVIGNTVQNFIKGIVGNDIYNGISRRWKLLSAIYTSAMNIYQSMLSSLSGLAEGIQVAGNYTGKIGNALKRGGVILENSYEWMDENLRVKMGKVAWLDRYSQELESVTDAVEDITQVPEEIIEIQDNYKDAKDQLKDIKETIKANEDAKKLLEDTNKTASNPGTIAPGADPPFPL